MAPIRRLPQALWIMALLLTVVPMVSQAASIPHSHNAQAPGLFNEDHDLTLLAASSTVAVSEAPTLLIAPIITAFISLRPASRPSTYSAGTTDSRAPPIR